MSILGTNDDVGSLLAIATGSLACSLVFWFFYLYMLAKIRGFKATTLPVLVISCLFPVIVPVAFLFGPVLPRHMTPMVVAIFGSSVLLSIAIWIDCKAPKAAIAPVLAAILPSIILTELTGANLLPLLLLAIVSWQVPVFAALHFFARPARRRQVIDPNACHICEYPQDGLPSDATCPECGTLHPLKPN